MFRPMKGIFKENLITVLPEDGFHRPKNLGGKLRKNIQICMNLFSIDTVQLTHSTEYVKSSHISNAVLRWFYYVYFVTGDYGVTMTSLISRGNLKKKLRYSHIFLVFSTCLSKYDAVKILHSLQVLLCFIKRRCQMIS